MRTRVLTSINEVAARDWDRLFSRGNPFTRHAFLAALEDSGSVCDATGWQPLHLLLEDDGVPRAAMPLYLKSHSYGEFVFDWAWAEAYRRNGVDYYPKLLTAVPFSPVAGPRVGVADGFGHAESLAGLAAAVRTLAADLHASGWHILFPDDAQQGTLDESGLADATLRREDVQFHWRNKAYATFDEFLATMRSSRRKNIRRERRRVSAQGIEMKRLAGAAITAADWEAFYRCYRETYRKRSGHDGYLNRAFFEALLESQRDHLLLVSAMADGGIVGSALFLFDDERLFGRYWGALEPIDCLHFEACFYQGIEFCIERGLQVFDPGTQGEHKLMRGFEPVRTASYHWLVDERFQAALAHWLEREKAGVSSYEESARAFLPFRRSEPG
jgi:predicted N-acyltransferase